MNLPWKEILETLRFFGWIFLSIAGISLFKEIVISIRKPKNGD